MIPLAMKLWDYRYCSKPRTVRILDLCRVQYAGSVEDVGTCNVTTSDGICLYVPP